MRSAKSGDKIRVFCVLIFLGNCDIFGGIQRFLDDRSDALCLGTFIEAKTSLRPEAGHALSIRPSYARYRHKYIEYTAATLLLELYAA